LLNLFSLQALAQQRPLPLNILWLLVVAVVQTMSAAVVVRVDFALQQVCP
jgi:hypothetical protein